MEKERRQRAKRWYAYTGRAVTFQEAPAAVMAQNDVTQPLLPPRAAGRETWPSQRCRRARQGHEVRFQPSAPLGARGLGTRPALLSFSVWSAQTGSVGRPCELYLMDLTNLFHKEKGTQLHRDRRVQSRLGRHTEAKLRRRVAPGRGWTSDRVCSKCLMSLHRRVEASPGVDQTQKSIALGVR